MVLMVLLMRMHRMAVGVRKLGKVGKRGRLADVEADLGDDLRRNARRNLSE